MQTDQLKTGYGKSITNAPLSTYNNSKYNSKDDDDNNDNDNNSSGNNESLQVPYTCVKFIKNDLPPGLHHNFDALIVPMWIDFISTLDNMWDISNFANEMQRIWDLALLAIKHTVSKLRDLVYKTLVIVAEE
ncbi:hypothetical protein EDD22DRAFT_850608 [Suillus occidentalis]|nr:hypothetical protein EDD22DRAFT_850608 [Suillus occidentalis]